MRKGIYMTPSVEEVFRLKAMNLFLSSSASTEDSMTEGDSTTITPIE